MNAALKRTLSAFGLLLIFAVALYLRFYGIDWAFKDGVHSPHPDERHYDSCAGVMQPQWLTAEEQQLPLNEKIDILIRRNFQGEPNAPYKPWERAGVNAGQPGLRPVNYNYGTLPLHMYLLYKHYLIDNAQSWQTPDQQPQQKWLLLGFDDWFTLGVFVFALFLGIKLFLSIRRDYYNEIGEKKPWYKDARPLQFFFPAMIMPIIGLMLMIFLPLELNNFDNYNPRTASLLLIGRMVTAWAGSLTVLLAYLIGRDAYNRMAGLIAAAFLATAMLHVQTSHFATVDVLVGFWSTLAVYSFLRIAIKPGLFWYIIGAIAVGFAVATKWSGVTLPGILLVAHACATWGNREHGRTGRWINTVWLVILALITLHFFKAASSNDPLLHITMKNFILLYWNYLWLWLAIIILLFIGSTILYRMRDLFHARTIGTVKPAIYLYKPWLWLVICIPIGVAAFFVGQPMAYYDAPHFARDIAEQSQIIVTGERPVPYTLQYNNTPGVFYFIDNLFYPSLDWFTAFWVLAGCLFVIGKIFFNPSRADLVLAAWVVPSLLLYGTFQNKFPRYLDSILPVMMVFAGLLLSSLLLYGRTQTNGIQINKTWQRFSQSFALVFGGLALICGTIYGFAYIGIYNEPHTLVQAGNILRDNMPAGSRVTSNTWDEGVRGIHIESRDQIGIHAGGPPDTQARARAEYLANYLINNDYVVFPSKRGYGSTLQNPLLFPVTNQFLQVFFAEQLGYKVAKVITNPPRFLWWEFRTDLEDETARIYDHPKVIIFEKFHEYDQETLVNRILNPPVWVTEITAREILSIQDGHPVYFQPPQAPMVSWFIFCIVLGWLGFLIIFPLCPALPDRGYAIGKIIGIALFAWLVWVLASAHIWAVSGFQMTFVFGIILISALWMALTHWQTLTAYLKQHWLTLLWTEVLFIALYAIFLVIKIFHPAAMGGEKPMNISFINAIYRTNYFPPEDPWISDFGVNYYYYGHMMFSVIGRYLNIPPEYLFNIAGPFVTALTGIAIFTLIYALCRKAFIALLGTYLCVFAGHIISFSLLINKFIYTHQYNWQEIFNTSWQEFFNAFGKLVQLMYYALLTYTGFANDETIRLFRGLDYNKLFWEARDFIHGTAADEFPPWTHLFMDFHAHMLVMPFVFAFLLLLYAYFSVPHRNHSNQQLIGLGFLLALLLGTIICTNTWDLPACMFAIIFATSVKFWREKNNLHDPLKHDWISPGGLQTMLRLPIAPIFGVGLVAFLLTYPFHFNFISRVNSVHFMTEGNTPIMTYLGLWGHLLIPIILGLIFFIIARRDGSISVKKTVLFTFTFVFILLFAHLVTYININASARESVQGWYLLNRLIFATHHPPGPPLDYTVVGLFLPFLIFLFFLMWQRWRDESFVFACIIGVLGLGLSMGIEFFYVREGWSEPNHRWNTAFKFNLQVWHYLSIFAVLMLFFCWRLLKQIGQKIGYGFTGITRTVLLLGTVILLLPTLPFVVIGPALITLTGGAEYRDAKGKVPSLNGLTYYQQQHYETYAAIKWLDRFTNDNPTIVEKVGKGYLGGSPFSSYTGLPAVIGWPHHAGERVFFNREKQIRPHEIQEKQIRTNDVEAIYTSDNKEEVQALLAKYNVQYLIFGEQEMFTRRGHEDRLPPLGKESLDRFQRWADIFRLKYQISNTYIYEIERSWNAPLVQADSPGQQLPPAQQPAQQGVSMYEASRGRQNGLFMEPRGLAIAPNGQVWVADSFNHRIQVFNPDGSFAWKLGIKGEGEGQFNEPNNVAINPQTGIAYITDTWNHRIVAVDPQGTVLGVVAAGFFGPRGIVYHPTLNVLYIADTGRNQIAVLTLEGEPVTRFGSQGIGEQQLREPVGITISPDNQILVVDGKNHRIKKMTPEGEVVAIWPIQTTAPTDAALESHIAAATDGTLYVTDPFEGSVHVYNQNGDLLEKLNAGINHEGLQRPVGITISPDGSVLVSDLNLSRVVRVK